MTAPFDAPGAGDVFGSRQKLVVLTAQGFAVHPLPESGTITLGSGASCDLRIDDPSVAVQHARLTVGIPSLVEDLVGKGTRVRDRLLAMGESVEVGPGDPVHLGSVTLMIEWKSGPPQRRILTDDYFELRVEEECHRAERSRSTFAVLGIRFESTVGAPAEELLASLLRLTDVIASHVPGSYEVLLPDTPPAFVVTIVSRLGARFAQTNLRARIGVALYPADSRSPDALLAKARLAPGPAAAPAAPEQLPPGEGSPTQVVYRMAELVAPTDMNVLIIGETGVGKERFAALIHAKSLRAKKPYVGLNCAALSESLLESELFGHEKGSFTGAQQAKPGLLEMASGGTVLLDEIGEMQLPIQGKLLRVIEERKMRRVGGLREIPIDVRFVAATNRDLEAESTRGLFRQDLFFRLNGVTLSIPPLRERPQEIESLAQQFLKDTSERLKRTQVPALSEAVLRLFHSYSWPGNIRELRNVVERAVVLCGDGPISAQHIPESKMRASLAPRRAATTPSRELSSGNPRPPSNPPPPLTASAPEAPYDGPERRGTGKLMSDDLQRRIQTEERERIVEALARCAGNQTAAAEMLGISRRTLVKRLSAHDLPRPRKRS